jgi:hypothetical protein
MLHLPDFIQWKELVETHLLLYSLRDVLVSDEANKTLSSELGYQITAQYMVNSLDSNTMIMLLRHGLVGDVKGIWDYVCDSHRDQDHHSRANDLNDLLFTAYTPLSETPTNYVKRFNSFASKNGMSMSSEDQIDLFIDNLSAAPQIREQILSSRPNHLHSLQRTFLEIS